VCLCPKLNSCCLIALYSFKTPLPYPPWSCADHSHVLCYKTSNTISHHSLSSRKAPWNWKLCRRSRCEKYINKKIGSNISILLSSLTLFLAFVNVPDEFGQDLVGYPISNTNSIAVTPVSPATIWLGLRIFAPHSDVMKTLILFSVARIENIIWAWHPFCPSTSMLAQMKTCQLGTAVQHYSSMTSILPEY